MTDQPATAGKGTAMVLDPNKLSPEGWWLLGGIEALNTAEATIRDIREKSTVVQERVFLAEIADLLRTFAEKHQAQLAELAAAAGAVEAQTKPQGVIVN